MVKRQLPILIVIVVGFLALGGHFINNVPLKNFIDNDTLPFIMNYKNSSDIDNYFDFKTAEFKFSLKK